MAHFDISPPVILPGHTVYCLFPMAHCLLTILSLGSACVVWGSLLTGSWERLGESLVERGFLKGLRKIYIHPASHLSLSGELTAKPPTEWFQWKKVSFNTYIWFQIEILSVWNEKIKRKVKMHEIVEIFCRFFSSFTL